MTAPGYLRLPLAKLERTFERLRTWEGTAAVPSGLLQIAEHCVRVATYLESRLNGSDHATAVKAQNVKARKVRKAIGYSYPNQPISF